MLTGVFSCPGTRDQTTTEIEDIVSAPTRAPESAGEGPAGGAQHSGTQATIGHSARRVEPQQLTGAQAVVRSLEELGVEVIFGIPGGAVLPVYDPLFDSQKLRHVLVRHE